MLFDLRSKVAEASHELNKFPVQLHFGTGKAAVTQNYFVWAEVWPKVSVAEHTLKADVLEGAIDFKPLLDLMTETANGVKLRALQPQGTNEKRLVRKAARDVAAAALGDDRIGQIKLLMRKAEPGGMNDGLEVELLRQSPSAVQRKIRQVGVFIDSQLNSRHPILAPTKGTSVAEHELASR